MEIYPSLSAIGEVMCIFILSPATWDQVIDGTGTPLAVQIKVTISPSSLLTVVLLGGSVIVTGSVGMILIQ